MIKEQQTKKTQILIVGGSGRLGRLLRCAWWTKPPKDSDVLFQSRSAGEGIDVVWSPFAGSDALRRETEGCKTIDAVVMLAGITPGSGSPMSDNVRLADACLEAAEALSIPRVLLASSSAVYGSGSAPFTETSPMQPLSDYGRSKVEMEARAADWRSRTGLEVICLRIGNVAGADALLGSVRHAADQVTIDQFSDGYGPIRSYVGPVTFAEIILTLSSSSTALPDVINVAAPQALRMEALAEAAGWDWKWRNASTSAVQNVVLDCSRLTGIHEFKPSDSSAGEMISQLRECRLFDVT